MPTATEETDPQLDDGRMTSVRIERCLDRRMRDYAAREGASLRHIIENGVRLYLETRNA